MSEKLDRQIKCLARELAMRRNVYPKWVASGRMKQEESDAEIDAMDGALRSLEFMKKWEGIIRSAVKLAKDEMEPFVGAGLQVDESKVTMGKADA